MSAVRRQVGRAHSRRKRFLGVAMGLVLAAGFAASIRAAVATENTDPDILALMARLPNDQAPGACDVPKAASASATALASASASTSASANTPTAASTPDAPMPAPSCAHVDHGGPFASDFVNIVNVTATPHETAPGRGASTGTFVSKCGRNENNHRNPDNFIVAPGVSNGAHHVHDYVGNLSTDGFSTDQSLAAAGTTCAGDDKSAYFWPVLRTLSKTGPDADQPGGGQDDNIGTIMRPSRVKLEFRGNAKSRVRAMPRFLRVITGDAKAGTNGVANARAAWSCTGFEDRTTTKYPLCPQGSGVVRTLDFPSCWDGKNTDSANHRSHIVFPKSDGSCWRHTVAVPQLRMVLTYAVPAKSLFALDTFPEQMHNPLTDHADFTNVMPDSLMKLAVNCINAGSDCDAEGPVATDPGPESASPTAAPSATATAAPTASRGAAPRNQASRQARALAPPPPARTDAAGSDKAPGQPAQGPRVAAPTASAPATGTDTGTGTDGTDSTDGTPSAQPGPAGDAVPAPVDTAQRQLAEPPLADATATGGGDAGAPDQAQTGTTAEVPAAGTGPGLAGVPAAPAPPAAAATRQAAAPVAADNRTLLYVLNAAALAALAGWLTVLVRRRRLR